MALWTHGDGFIARAMILRNETPLATKGRAPLSVRLQVMIAALSHHVSLAFLDQSCRSMHGLSYLPRTRWIVRLGRQLRRICAV